MIDSEENNVNVDIYKELGVSDRNNPLELINKVQLHEDNPQQQPIPTGQSSEESLEEVPFMFSIIRVIVLPDSSESENEEDGKAKNQTDVANIGPVNDSDNGYPFFGIISSGVPREPSPEQNVNTPAENETWLQREKEAEEAQYKEYEEQKEKSIQKPLSDSILVENKPEGEKKIPESSTEVNSEIHPLPEKVLPADSTKATLVTSDKSGELHNMFYDFMDFSIPNAFICPKDGENMNLLVGIHSDVENFEQRKAIRETWSKVARLDGINYAFIVGIGISDSIDNKIKHESDEFQDMIQTDILARHKYRDANPVMFLKWVKKYCPQVKNVIKADDNVFLNLPQISQLLKENETKENQMYGDLYVDELPDRNPDSEDYVAPALFSGDTYPEFLNRAAYLFPGKLAPKLYDEARKIPYFPGENILITGTVAEKLNITRTDTSDLFVKYADVEDQLEKCSFLKYSVVYPLTPDQMRSLWDEIKSTDYKCFGFLEKMLGMIDDKEGKEENIYDQQVKVYDLLNDEKLTPKNKKYEDLLE